ncbi:hypothetical protein DRW07_03370 [Alteromonas sediminis]|uniref:Cardiolipin synthase N-terminal domain-containing protein n=1 Tax=Alteromonas sediminis TaxID=2259342 RepID=A0A3N5YAB9_9ALTE|nr:hypothetical protein DRW07_03370 [Alteromonas sediminis]
MLTAFLFVLCFIVFAVFYCVNAMKSGLNPKVWLLLGLCLGPFILPMFVIQRHIQWRKSVGFNNVYITV